MCKSIRHLNSRSETKTALMALDFEMLYFTVHTSGEMPSADKGNFEEKQFWCQMLILKRSSSGANSN